MSNNNSDRTQQILDLIFPLYATITCDGAPDNYVYEDEKAALADNRIHPAEDTHDYCYEKWQDRQDEEDGPCTDPNCDAKDLHTSTYPGIDRNPPTMWRRTFWYANKQGKTSSWTVNLNEAVYFDFRSTYYMVIRGDRGGPVCFKLNGCMKTTDLTLVADVEGVFDFLEADPDCFPTEGTQDWMLKQLGF